MNVAVTTFELPNEIKNPERDQGATGEERKHAADPIIDRHPAPNDQHAECCREQSMSRAGESGDGERFGVVPVLGSRRDHEWKPVCRDYRVEEADGKAAGQQRDENNVIHFRAMSVQPDTLARPSQRPMNETRINSVPNVQTIAAPDGRSHQ